mgnify:CR=1 FL=1
MICNMDLEKCNGETKLHTKASFSNKILREEESIYGPTVEFMMESGAITSCMAVEFSLGLMEIYMREIS